ncbi:hypothetical protein [Psychrobacillus sp. OK032]|uniref:hypothetical protein n=1 Tax=Psychrobacillus sp. OK032 TaxID=1884358 RepID=UPI000B32A54A|nr:hypothetical protein [Psychrobacillus sp. OK032]
MELPQGQLISAPGGRFPRAWLQSPQANTTLVTKALPHEVAFLAFVPLPAPAGLSAHAPAASLSVQKTSAIPAGVAAFRFNQWN